MGNEMSSQPGIYKQKPNAEHFVDITFKSTWDYIPVTKAYIENILLIEISDLADIHKVGTAASELLENATKFSMQKDIRAIIRKLEPDNEIELVVYNNTDQQHANSLSNRIEEMNKVDSLQYYLFRMKESIKNKDESAGLGLARVYHEASARVSASYDNVQQIVEVKAIIKL